MRKLISFLVMIACVFNASAQNKFTDPVYQKIYTLQEERNTAGLLPYFKNENEAYREAAAMAFASVQDKEAIDPLMKLLKDKGEKVRIAAAFSLGQMKDSTIVKELISAFNNEQSFNVKGALYEALGKCGTRKALEFIVSKNWYPENSAILVGQARALFWLANKRVTSKEGTEKAVELLTTKAHTDEVRLAAANYFARAKSIDLTPYFQEIREQMFSDPNVFVQIALARSIGKVDRAELKAVIPKLLEHPDQRVQVNAVYGIRSHKPEVSEEVLLTVLRSSSSAPVTITAAEGLLELAKSPTPDVYPRMAAEAKDWRTKALLLAASLRFTSPTEKAKQSEQIISQYKSSQNIYEKGMLLTALGHYEGNHKFIAEQTFNSKETVLRTYGTEALTAIRKYPGFASEDTSLFRTFAGYFRQALESNDVAMIAIAGDALRDTSMKADPGHKKGEPKIKYSDIGFMEKALKQLVLPRDIETYMALQRTIDLYKGKETRSLPDNSAPNPIDWQFVGKLSSAPRVAITTTKGDILMTLYTDQAPGTVANFIKLANEGFYKDKVFHRVVPNFVAQTGCPRGDGYGNTNYTIRSEFSPLRYEEGTLGMASAGKDTEGSQWFITHSPAPHLEGSYTIFGKVDLGMDVIMKLEVGDKILSVATR